MRNVEEGKIRQTRDRNKEKNCAEMCKRSSLPELLLWQDRVKMSLE